MKIIRVEALPVKLPHGDFFGGKGEAHSPDTRSEYLVQPGWRGIYGRRIETMVVRIEADSGLVGWGEGQSPIAPEVAATIVDRILADVLVGRDPMATAVIYHDLFDLMAVRGHGGGFMVDAIAAVDIALWDLKGKALGVPIALLLGGPARERVPCYVSGIRGDSPAAMVDEICRQTDLGFSRFKLFGGFGIERDGDLMESLLARAPRAVAFDALWRYDRNQAMALGRRLAELGTLWFEAPCDPADIAGHALLARTLALPVAGGETERTRQQFRPWLEAGALEIAQPDIGRCGITEGVRIIDLAALMHVPVTLHCGMASPIMIAASLQVAAAHPHVSMMEYQPIVLAAGNSLLREKLCCEEGLFRTSGGPGLGIEIDEPVLRGLVTC